MCITSGPAKLSNTLLYAAEALHPTEGEVHVIGYQNTAENQGGGPNAMLLPFPAVGEISQRNLVNGESFKTILQDYSQLFEPLGRSRSVSNNAEGFKVFNSGSYTIALAPKASGLIRALEHIPINRRPTLSAQMVHTLGALYPQWPFALCCWDGRIKAEPLFWWYKPTNPTALFAPALDAHDGAPPNTQAMVERDHTIMFASHKGTPKWESRYRLDSVSKVPPEHRWMFPPVLVGEKVKRSGPNGDYTHAVFDVLREKYQAQISAPPGLS